MTQNIVQPHVTRKHRDVSFSYTIGKWLICFEVRAMKVEKNPTEGQIIMTVYSLAYHPTKRSRYDNVTQNVRRDLRLIETRKLESTECHEVLDISFLSKTAAVMFDTWLEKHVKTPPTYSFPAELKELEELS